MLAALELAPVLLERWGHQMPPPPAVHPGATAVGGWRDRDLGNPKEVDFPAELVSVGGNQSGSGPPINNHYYLHKHRHRCRRHQNGGEYAPPSTIAGLAQHLIPPLDN